MIGVLVVVASCVLGAAVAQIDVLTGVAVVVAGGVLGMVMTWIDLS